MRNTNELLIVMTKREWFAYIQWCLQPFRERYSAYIDDYILSVTSCYIVRESYLNRLIKSEVLSDKYT